MANKFKVSSSKMQLSVCLFSILLVIVHGVAATGSAQGNGDKTLLTVAVSAPWRSSTILEQAEFFADTDEKRFWQYVDSENKSLFVQQSSPAEVKQLQVSLKAGEFIARVAAQAQLAESLRTSLEFRKCLDDAWVAVQTSNGVFATCDEKELLNSVSLPSDSGTCSVSSDVALATTPLDHIFARSAQDDLRNVIVHGNLVSSLFVKLWNAAKTLASKDNSVQLILRLEPTKNEEQSQPRFGGFSVSLDIKNTEYVAVDRAFERNKGGDDQQQQDTSSLESGIYFDTLLDQFKSEPETQVKLNVLKTQLKNDREKLKAWEVSDISIQLALDVLQAADPLVQLKDITENLPSHARRLAKIQVPDEMRKSLSVRPQLNTQVWMNGIRVDLQDEISVVLKQLRKMARLGDFAQSTGVSKRDFENWLATKSKKTSWGTRIDVRKYAKGAVGFMNDIEKDRAYASLSKSLAPLRNKSPANPMQLVPIGRNLYTCILMLDPASSEDMEHLAVVRYFVRVGAPVRFGLVLTNAKLAKTYAKETAKEIPMDDKLPCADSGDAEHQCSSTRCIVRLYAAAKKELGADPALSFIGELASQLSPDNTKCADVVKLFADSLAQETRSWSSGKFRTLAETALKDEDGDYEASVRKYARYVGALGLSVPSLTFNGMLVDLGASKSRLDRIIQPLLFQEQSLLRQASDNLADEEDILGQILRLSQAGVRNSRLVNVPLNKMTFVPLTKPQMESLDIVYLTPKSQDNNAVRMSLWVPVGDEGGCKVVLAALEVLNSRVNVRVGLIGLSDELRKQQLASLDVDSIKQFLETKCASSAKSSSWKNVLGEDTLVVCNGRALRKSYSTDERDDVIGTAEIVSLIDMEQSRISEVPMDVEADRLIGISTLLGLHAQLMEESTASFTMMGESREKDTLAYFATKDEWNMLDSVASDDNKDDWTRPTLRVLVDPLSQLTPKTVAFALWMRQEMNAQVSLALFPKPDVGQLPPSSFHRWAPEGSAAFTDLPPDQLLTLKVHTPQSWIVYASDLGKRDPDNLLMSEGSLDAIYDIAHVLIDGHASIAETGEPAAGMQMQLVEFDGLIDASSIHPRVVADSIVMYNLGYWQMKAKPGFYKLRPLKGYSLANGEKERLVSFADFAGPGAVELQVQKDSSSSSSSSLEPTQDDVGDDDIMHVFSLASGALYERFLRIMMLSVRKRSSGKIKFWLLENYMSAAMKRFMPDFAKRNNFSYELVTFKWPDWLRGQSERQRQIWGMKILFLDVLFPLSVKRIIYVDSDQVLRADLRELWKMDLRGAPYAMTPFCDSRKETLGFQFWRQGYWASHLRGLHYHISALFVVDLVKFRNEATGDRLRAVYQQLSADPNSLSNLDQDLPNFAQHDIPIFSLPQEWLWCESWCSDESKAKAKTIDLCNNPLHKEPKLEMAKRVIKGDLFKESWEDLDREVGWTG